MQLAFRIGQTSLEKSTAAPEAAGGSFGPGFGDSAAATETAIQTTAKPQTMRIGGPNGGEGRQAAKDMILLNGPQWNGDSLHSRVSNNYRVPQFGTFEA